MIGQITYIDIHSASLRRVIIVTYTGKAIPRCVCPGTRLALFIHSGFAVAIAAVNWFALSGFEWYLSLFATLGAYRGKHFPLRLATVATTTTTTSTSITLCFPRLTAGKATLGLVRIA